LFAKFVLYDYVGYDEGSMVNRLMMCQLSESEMISGQWVFSMMTHGPSQSDVFVLCALFNV